MVKDSLSMSVELESVLRRYLKYAKNGEPIDPKAPLTKLGLDSMSSINLMLDLETTFDVLIPDEMLTPEVFATMESLQQALSQMVAK